ncbi:unnamed protein product, partial [Amoebophrya sp. A120]
GVDGVVAGGQPVPQAGKLAATASSAGVVEDHLDADRNAQGRAVSAECTTSTVEKGEAQNEIAQNRKQREHAPLAGTSVPPARAADGVAEHSSADHRSILQEEQTSKALFPEQENQKDEEVVSVQEKKKISNSYPLPEGKRSRRTAAAGSWIYKSTEAEFYSGMDPDAQNLESHKSKIVFNCKRDPRFVGVFDVKQAAKMVLSRCLTICPTPELQEEILARALGG